jgi:isoleucyl-tRNA synthetase
MPQDYNATLNLPKTGFPMRAELPKREPDWLKTWYDKDIYGKMTELNADKPRFVLHDGPPFSNGYIHMGTSLNKVLKDFIVRYKNMTGWRAKYVPGWDNHGMPIESAIIKQNKLDRKKMSVSEFRSACRDFAEKYVGIQREQFKRLGVLGDWEHPYLTMSSEFEAEEVKVFGKMYEKGYIYKGLKPVYWCPHDETALAEAEIEYADDKCRSIYVKFKVKDDKGKLGKFCDLDNTYFVIWTTTTWTLPGNLAICVNPEFTYVLMKTDGGETYILAEELAQNVLKQAKIEGAEVLAKFKGSDFELMTAQHPFMDRESILLCGEHVTLEAGTGCVHTAPGHGADDYNICRRYDDSGLTHIGTVVPVDSSGYMNELAGQFAGLFYDKANGAILSELESSGALLCSETITHQYPHCWRCKQPIIYRATDQWFCSVDSFKEEAVKAAENVTWLPEWGGERIVSMVRDRADWCISRQRRWGLPIPVFYCKTCGKPICTPETIERVSGIFAEKGSNAWYDLDAAAILPVGFACPHCGAAGDGNFEKEVDTLDGWFDSGSTHIASLAKDDPSDWPADIYLEGADQFRGWFQSSLLTAVAVKGRAPYKTVLTHGWTVDGEGKAMHKSVGNVVAPEEIVEKYGADMLRLWVASSDYRVDVRVSDKLFKQLSDIYLKIRNTARYILGNLDGFEPDSALPFDRLQELDRWAVSRMNALVRKVRAAYERYEFHLIYHAVHNFCVIDMSSFYLDIIKDRLYCEDKNGELRRSAQTAMYMILDGMVRMLAPILSFTAEEIWQSMPHACSDKSESVMFNSMTDYRPDYELDEETNRGWERMLRLRADVNKALELARAEKVIGKPLDAEVTLFFEDKKLLEAVSGYDLKTIFIVSKVELVHGRGEGYKGEFEGVSVKVGASAAPRCDRCWTHDELTGDDGLCPRCRSVVERR